MPDHRPSRYSARTLSRRRFTAPLRFETLEDRSVPAAIPVVDLVAPAAPFIGQQPLDLAVTFRNTGTSPGYGPWAYAILDSTGADGNDGLSFVNGSATYLGLPVVTAVRTLSDATGDLSSAAPAWARDPSTNAGLTKLSAATGRAGDQVVFFQLPFGSFAAGQPNGTINFKAALSNLADLSVPLNVTAGGGLTYGNTELDDFSSDPPQLAQGTASQAVSPVLYQLEKTYIGPENETATGPSYQRQYRLDVKIAPGQTITNLLLSDVLPDSVQYVRTDVATGRGAGSGSGPVATPAQTVPGGTLSYNFDTVTADSDPNSVDASLLFTFFVPRDDAAGASVLPLDDGAFKTILNGNTDPAAGQLTPVSSEGTWAPIDPRDPTQTPAETRQVLQSAVPVEAQSIAIQKGVTVVGGGIPKPGAVVEYTLDFQVSDYFAFDDVNLDDLLPDGLRFDGTFVPVFEFTGHTGTTTAASPMQAGNYTVGVADPVTGKQALQFRVSDELATRFPVPGADQLVGGNIPVGGTDAETIPPNYAYTAPDTYASSYGPTTGRIVFRAIVQRDYLVPPNANTNDDVKQGDALTNTATVDGDVLKHEDLTPTGINRIDDTAATVAIPTGQVAKSVYAINGVRYTGTTPPQLQPGDLVTYRLSYVLPTSTVQAFQVTDYLPLPVFSAADVTTFTTGVGSAAAPAAGVAQFGPGLADAPAGLTLPAGTVNYTDIFGTTNDPTVSTDAGTNAVAFTFPTNLQDPVVTQRASLVDLLFTVRINGKAFADQLFLTNQVDASESNSHPAATTTDQIVQVELLGPAVTTIKGVVSTTATGASFSSATSPAGVTFAAPGIGGFTVTGGATVNSSNVSQVNSNLSGVDADDRVKFAVVVENRGTGPRGAFDVTFKDTLPAGFRVPTAAEGGLNLTVQYGDGTTAVYTGTDADLFGAGLQLVDPSATQGSLARGKNADGSVRTDGLNLVVVTYDLIADETIAPNQKATNTATVVSYNSTENDPTNQNFVSTDGLPDSDTATVTAKLPTQVKTLVGTSVTGQGNNAANQAVVGEVVTYTVTVTVPEGVTPAAFLADQLDPGLALVDVVSVASSSPDLTYTGPGTATVTNSGHTVTFDFGTITNANRDNAVAETITLTYRAVVLNVVGNQAGTTLGNSARFAWQNNSTTLTPVSAGRVTVVEPTVTTAKTVVVNNGTTNGFGDARDPLQYTIALSAPSTGPAAFDVTLNDPLPVNAGGSLIVGGSGAGDQTAPAFTINDSAGLLTAADFEVVGTYAAGFTLRSKAGVAFDLSGTRTVTVTINGFVSAAAVTNATVANTAVATFTSLDGAVPGPLSVYNPASGERTGADGPGGALNDYAATGTASFPVVGFSPVKQIVATSEADTSDTPAGTAADPRPVAVGEIVRYRVYVRVAEGTTPALTLVDTLPTGMVYLPGMANVRIATVSNGAGFQLPALGAVSSVTGSAAAYSGLASNLNWTAFPAGRVTQSGQAVTFDLGTVTNNDGDPDAEYVLVEFNALVSNAAVDQSGANLDNKFEARVSGTAFGGPSAVARVTVVEPVITNLAKDVVAAGGVTVIPNPVADAGDAVRYRATFTNTGNATAFDAVYTDPLPAGITLMTDSVSVYRNGVQISPLLIDTSNNTVTVKLLHVDVNDVITVRYAGTVAQSVRPNSTLASTATVTYTGLPGTGTVSNPTGVYTPGASGAPAGERNGQDGEPTDGGLTLPLNNYKDSDPASVATPNGAVVKTLAATDLGLTAGADLAIGETATYRLAVTLPEGTTTGLVVTDRLPPGLAYVAGSATLDLTGFTGTVPNPTVTGGAADGDDVAFSFGPITVTGNNNANDNTFVIVLRAVVVNAGTSGTAGAQTSLPNDATLKVGAGPTITADPVTATVVEPKLQVVKTVLNADTSIDARTTVNYQVVISHASTSTGPAYDLNLTDLLASVGMDLVPGSVAVSAPAYTMAAVGSGAGGNVTVTALRLSPGDTITVTYSASLRGAGANGPAPGSTVTNTATVGYDTYPGANPNQRTETPVSSSAQVTVNTYSVAGKIYSDLNDNGVFEPGAGETLITKSVTVTLTGKDRQGNVVSLSTTTSTGTYSFTGLRPSDGAGYTVTESTQPTGFLDGRDTPGTPFGGTGTAATDARAPRDADKITTVVLPPNAAQDGVANAGVNYDFGELPPASLGDRVWEDLNGNGVQDGGEPGVIGITVRLTGTDDTGRPVTATTTTGANGAYSFDNLRPGTYTVTFGTTANGKAYQFTVPDSTAGGGTDATDSDANPATGKATVTLAAGQNNPTIDAGLYLPISLGNRVYYDLDGDGIQDADEPGIVGATVAAVWYGPDGVAGGGDDMTFTAVTGANGIWNLTGLPPGNYSVASAGPAGGGFTTLTDSLDDGTLAPVNPLALTAPSGTARTDLDFGYRGTGELGDRVWNDVNADGVQDPGEPGLTGVPVTVRWFGQDGVENTTDDIVYPVQTTGPNGMYLFDNLPAGKFRVTIDPTSTGLAPVADPDTGTVNPDATAVVTLAPGVPLLTADFGLGGTDLAVVKTIDNPAPVVGYTVTFTVTVTNKGGATANNVVVTDKLPAGLALLSATPAQGTYTGGTGEWAVGTLTPGQTATLTVVARVMSPDAQTNTANVTHLSLPDLDPTNNTGTATETPVLCDGGLLSAAGGFNVFVFGDANVSGSESLGRVAVGGNATFSGYGIGDGLPASNGTRDDLVVGGNVTYTSGQLFAGNLVYGGTANLNGVGFLSGSARQGTPAVPIDFTAVRVNQQVESQVLAARPANGATQYSAGNLTLTGTDPAINVFSIPGSLLATAYSVNVSAPTGSVVIINVTGTSAKLVNLGINLNGVPREKVIWNFADATDLEISGVAVQGSILAPNAAVRFNGGAIDGTLVAASLTGNGEFHDFPTQVGCVAYLQPSDVSPTGPVKNLAGTVSFWQGTAGQNLIKAFGGSAASTALGNWLAATYGNLYGAGAGAGNSLAGKTNAFIATKFQQLAGSTGTLPDAQVFAAVLSVYATQTGLGGGAAAVAAGFAPSAGGLAATVWNVGNQGDLFGPVANGTTRTVGQMLQAVNAAATGGQLYAGDGGKASRAGTAFADVELVADTTLPD